MILKICSLPLYGNRKAAIFLHHKGQIGPHAFSGSYFPKKAPSPVARVWSTSLEKDGLRQGADPNQSTILGPMSPSGVKLPMKLAHFLGQLRDGTVHNGVNNYVLNGQGTHWRRF